jgi:hypothetical protein
MQDFQGKGQYFNSMRYAKHSGTQESSRFGFWIERTISPPDHLACHQSSLVAMYLSFT